MLSSQANAVEPGASYFHAVTPDRLCDTRDGYGYEGVAANWIRIPIAGVRGIPSDAVAVVLTLTGVNRGLGNWLSAFPAGEAWPGTSNVNLDASDFAIANLVTVKLGHGGQVDVLSLNPCDVVVDVAGVYRPTGGPVSSGRYQALDNVVRVLDTQTTGKPGPGSVVTVNLNGIVPSDATAVVANLTAAWADAPGWLRAYPTGTAQPASSNVNVWTGDVRAVGIMTKLNSANGVRGFDVATLQGCHIIVDVAGYITGAGAASSDSGLFVPVTPVRQLDTRRDRVDGKTKLWAGWTRAFAVPGSFSTKAQAVAMNVTATQTMGPGFFTMHAGQTPRAVVSNLNTIRPHQTVANHAIVRLSGAGIAAYSSAGAHVICDITGWFTGGLAPVTTGVPVNPPPPGGPLPWTLQVPRMGLTTTVFDGPSADPVVNAGYSWHWAGTGLPSQNAAISVFGHRTEHGGPYRNQHYLQTGDSLYLYTADGRRYEYLLWTEAITSNRPSDILATSRQVSGETISLISCTRLDGTPTDTDYRLISTFALAEWVDLT